MTTTTRPIKIEMELKGVDPGDRKALEDVLRDAAGQIARELIDAALRKEHSLSVTGSTNSQGVSSVGATYTIKW